MSLDLSIVIVTFNSDSWLRNCLRSVFAHITQLSFEVIVVDNGSSADNLRYFSSVYPEIKTVRLQEQQSLSRAINDGLRLASGNYFLWLNPDVVFLNDRMSEWIAYLEQNPTVGISGPKVYDDEEREVLQYSCRKFPSVINSLFNRNSLLTKFFPNNRISQDYLMSNWDHNETQEVDWVSGCCMLLKSEMLDQIGLLDEEFPLFCEDIDICLRAWQHGWQVVFFPSMEIAHYTGSVRAQSPFRAIVKEHQSLWHYYLKHFDHIFIAQGAIYLALRVRLLSKLLSMAFRRYVSPH